MGVGDEERGRRALRRRVTCVARVVLPEGRVSYGVPYLRGERIYMPEPGIPEMAMRSRSEGGRRWYFSCGGDELLMV